MVTMKWTVDEQGRPVSAWQAGATTQAKDFGPCYYKAVRLTTSPRLSGRRSLRTLAALAVTAVVK